MSHPVGLIANAGAGAALSWSFEPAVVLPVAAAATLYLRGWVTLSRRLPERFDRGRAAGFAAGLAALLLALCSPMDALSRHFLQAHMAQHLLLMAVAPPLLWLGAPVAPLLLGLPRPARRAVAAGLGTRPLRWVARCLADPRIAWLAFVLAFWLWHIPALYDWALRSDGWHHVEHASFFLTGLVFWRPVILAWPARSTWPRWAMVVYLLLAETQNTVLSAILAFSDRVIYPFYASAGRPGGIGALEDQALAGVIMWVPGSLAFTLPALWLFMTMLTTPVPEARVAERPAPSAS